MNISMVADGVPNLAPYILVSGSMKQPEQAFLVVDKKIVTEVICFEDIPLTLLSAFFVFNIKYPPGCNNFYSFLEILILNFLLKKASITVKHLFTTLN